MIAINNGTELKNSAVQHCIRHILEWWSDWSSAVSQHMLCSWAGTAEGGRASPSRPNLWKAEYYHGRPRFVNMESQGCASHQYDALRLQLHGDREFEGLCGTQAVWSLSLHCWVLCKPKHLLTFSLELWTRTLSVYRSIIITVLRNVSVIIVYCSCTAL